MNEQEKTETTPNPTIPPKRRTRRNRKRTVFHKAPRPAWPVRGLWESAPEEARQQAHTTCMKILEYWLGKKTKAQVAEELSVSGLRVWQLSQQALSGMLAGLLKQPRCRVGPEVFQPGRAKSREQLQKRIGELEAELARTEDLVRVLRTAPWMSSSSESSVKEGSKRGRKKTARRTKSTRAPRAAPASRPVPPRERPLDGGASGGG